jgi:hypothetical protein
MVQPRWAGASRVVFPTYYCALGLFLRNVGIIAHPTPVSDTAFLPGRPIQSRLLSLHHAHVGLRMMKKPPAKLREEIRLLQDQLRAAETREAERLGRLALKAGFGEFDIDEDELLVALQSLASRFRSVRADS